MEPIRTFVRSIVRILTGETKKPTHQRFWKAFLGLETLEVREVLSASLFAGHSFFIPIAHSFDELAQQNGFTDHEADFVFAPGAGGFPGQLWENEDTRNAITEKLATGEVELFGLTAFGGSGGSTFEDYQQWFDIALTFNPDTEFFIGSPWVLGGPQRETAEFDQAIEANGERAFEVVEQLREAYPNNDIVFINYGKAASIMKADFEAGELSDILGLVPDPDNLIGLQDAFFDDRTIGHAGPMMTEVSALSWLSILYDVDVETLDYTDYQSDVESIVDEVVTYNQQFQSVDEDPEPEILSAYLGAVDVRFPRALENVSGADQAVGDDGMPLVLFVQVNAATLSPEDFLITTASGATNTPTAVTLAPADESDESRTILLTGPLGSENDLPVSVEIVGSLLSVDGQELQDLFSEVTTNENGPELVLALIDPAETDPDGNETTHTRIQLTWQGGVTGRFGSQIKPKELRDVRIIDQNGDAHRPTGFEELEDNDNHVVLVVPQGVTPERVEVRAGTFYDPTNQPNPETSVEITGTINLEEEPVRHCETVFAAGGGDGQVKKSTKVVAQTGLWLFSFFVPFFHLSDNY